MQIKFERKKIPGFDVLDGSVMHASCVFPDMMSAVAATPNLSRPCEHVFASGVEISAVPIMIPFQNPDAPNNDDKCNLS